MSEEYNLTRAKKYAAYSLGSRMYTCHEIEDKLRRKGYSQEIAEQVIEEFCRVGYLNDKTYAELYIVDSVNLNYKGMYRIKQELALKGVARSVIDRAAEETEADVYAKLCEYVKSHFADMEISDWKELERIKAKLARRGYSSQDIRNCFDDLDIRVKTE